MQSVIILLYCNAFGVAWFGSVAPGVSRGLWNWAKGRPPGGGVGRAEPPGECIPRNLFLFFIFLLL